jgi:hypothetical protein
MKHTTKMAAAIVLGAIAAAAALPPRAQAEIVYPWCLIYGGSENGSHNCGFVSFEQCLASARGAGGTCVQNVQYQGLQQTPGARRAKRNN